MKVSVITVTYNSAKTLKDTIDSVIAQDHPDMEYIIVDGNSNDGTQEIVQSYGDSVTRFVSERDQGIYDALNKGILMASGDIVALLHSDDVFHHSGVISRVVQEFQSHKMDLLCTAVEVCSWDDLDKITRYCAATVWKPWMFRIGYQPPHPGFFVKREVYTKYGLFNMKYRISADFDLMLRFIKIHRLNTRYRDFITVRMREGGTSNAGFSARMKANAEDHQSLRSHGYFSWLPLIYLKYFIKGFQWVKKAKD
ncbi:MAG: hypothetical protein RL160_1648 [Bacteroidota bacterium]|jgi:glycosyltransferase involved in cell wall biosynthesis